MIRRLVNASLRFRVLLTVAAVAVMLTGVTQLPKADKDIYPEFEPPTVEVQTEALGLSAAEVEQLITAPLEADLLNGVAWVDDIHSESVTGLSSVTMVFEPGTDLFKARQAVQERLAQAHALPQVSKPPQMIQPTSSTSRTMLIGLTSKKLSLIDLSELARWTIKPRLQGVEGVANVASFGHRERQLQVQVDPERLAANRVGLLDVVETAGNALWVSPLTFLEASTPGTGGFIETKNQRLGIRHVQPIESAEELAKVTVEDRPGLALGDVTTVVQDHQPLIGDALVGGGKGIVLVVEKLRGANTVDVTDGVEKALAGLRPALKDVKVDTSIFRPADYVRSGSDNLTKAMLGALALIVALLAFAFYQWRAALISTVAIGTSMLGAALVLTWRGESLNSMVMAGLALALASVIDDGIAAADRVIRRLRDGGESQGAGAAVVAALTEVRGPLGYATAFVLLPVLPVYFMGDLFGAFGRPLATSYGIALLVSMVTALTVVPALSVLLFTKASHAGTESGLVAGLGRRYTGALGRVLAAPRRPLAVAGVIALAGVVALPQLSQSELPALRERDFLVELEAAPGTSLVQMNRTMAEATGELRQVPGVRNVAGHAGRAISGDQVVNVNKAELWVSLDVNADYGKAVKGMEAVLDNYDEFDTDTLTYQQFALKELDDGADGPIVVRVYGHNNEVLAAKATEVGEELEKIDGIADLDVELPVNEPTLEVEVDLERAAEYGVKPGDVRRAAATMLSGIVVGNLFYDQKIFEVVVWGAPETREDPADVRNLLIETPARGLVPLSEIADVRKAESPDVIEREGAFRRIDITADVTGRSRGAVASDVKKTISGIDFPLEYRAELLGGYVEKQADKSRLMAIGGFSLLAMLLLLQAGFGSWKLGTLFFLTLPVSLAGGLVAAVADGGDISIGAALGLLAVLAIAARGGISLISRCQHLQRVEGMAFGPELVAQAARERLAPALMTAGASGLAFVPVMLIGDVAGHEIIHPMGVVVLGGLLSATLVNLVVVPALYLAFGGKTTATELDLLLFEEEFASGAGPSYADVPVLVGANGSNGAKESTTTAAATADSGTETEIQL